MRCFESLGYEETTTAAIAREAGVGVGTLYGYFRDKRAVLLEVLGETTGKIAEPVLEGLEPERWREGDLRARVRELIAAVFHSRSVSPGIQRIVWERYFKDEAFRDAVLAIDASIRTALERLLEELAAEGRLRVQDFASAAYVVHNAVEWTATRLVLREDDTDVDDAVAATSDMVSRFLLDDEAWPGTDAAAPARGARDAQERPERDETGRRERPERDETGRRERPTRDGSEP